MSESQTKAGNQEKIKKIENLKIWKRRYGDKAEKSCVRQFVADHIIMEVRQRLYLVHIQF